MAVHEALQTYLSNSALRLLVLVAIPLILGILYLSSRFPFPPKAPILTSQNYPIVGALGFFTERWTFCQRASAHSPTGNYSFHLGKHPVIGVSGEEGRKVFFENRQLGFSEGYARVSALQILSLLTVATTVKLCRNVRTSSKQPVTRK
jgi:hypothetical protein